MLVSLPTSNSPLYFHPMSKNSSVQSLRPMTAPSDRVGLPNVSKTFTLPPTTVNFSKPISPLRSPSSPIVISSKTFTIPSTTIPISPVSPRTLSNMSLPHPSSPIRISPSTPLSNVAATTPSPLSRTGGIGLPRPSSPSRILPVSSKTIILPATTVPVSPTNPSPLNNMGLPRPSSPSRIIPVTPFPLNNIGLPRPSSPSRIIPVTPSPLNNMGLPRPSSPSRIIPVSSKTFTIPSTTIPMSPRSPGVLTSIANGTNNIINTISNDIVNVSTDIVNGFSGSSPKPSNLRLPMPTPSSPIKTTSFVLPKPSSPIKINLPSGYGTGTTLNLPMPTPSSPIKTTSFVLPKPSSPIKINLASPNKIPFQNPAPTISIGGNTLNGLGMPNISSGLTPSSPLKTLPMTPLRIPNMNTPIKPINQIDMNKMASADEILNKEHYTIISHILATLEDKTYAPVQYVKCYDARGNTVFVNLDIPGTTTDVRISRSTNVKPVTQDSINYSIKNSVDKCMGSAVCGVAIECNEQLCMLTKQNDGSTKQNSYLVTMDSRDQSSPTTAIISSITQIPSVIVRLSEIEKNPKSVLRNTSEAMEKIRTQAFNEESVTFKDSMREVEKLAEAARRFHQLYNSTFEKLRQSSKEILNIVETFDKKVEQGYKLTEQESINYRVALSNLFARNKMFGDSVNLTRDFANMRNDFGLMIEKIAKFISVESNYEQKAWKQLTADEVNTIISM